jgi:hypothetical protein
MMTNERLLEIAKKLDSYTIKSVWGSNPSRRHNKHIIKAMLRPKKKNYFTRWVTYAFDNPTSTTL